YKASPTTMIYTLSLHDALPISSSSIGTVVDASALHHELHPFGDSDVRERVAGNGDDVRQQPRLEPTAILGVDELGGHDGRGAQRSEEHTSELQSLAYLVCRPLL